MTPEPQSPTYTRGLYNHRCVYCPPLSKLKGTMVDQNKDYLIFRLEGKLWVWKCRNCICTVHRHFWWSRGWYSWQSSMQVSGHQEHVLHRTSRFVWIFGIDVNTEAHSLLNTGIFKRVDCRIVWRTTTVRSIWIRAGDADIQIRRACGGGNWWRGGC